MINKHGKELALNNREDSWITKCSSIKIWQRLFWGLIVGVSTRLGFSLLGTYMGSPFLNEGSFSAVQFHQSCSWVMISGDDLPWGAQSQHLSCHGVQSRHWAWAHWCVQPLYQGGALGSCSVGLGREGDKFLKLYLHLLHHQPAFPSVLRIPSWDGAFAHSREIWGGKVWGWTTFLT